MLWPTCVRPWNCIAGCGIPDNKPSSRALTGAKNQPIRPVWLQPERGFANILLEFSFAYALSLFVPIADVTQRMHPGSVGLY